MTRTWLTVLAILLLFDGLTSGALASQYVSTISVRGAVFDLTLVARVVVSGLSVVCGWLILRRRPQGVALAPLALMASAALTTVEVGLDVLPPMLSPAWRWPAIAAAWIYALGWSWYVRRV